LFFSVVCIDSFKNIKMAKKANPSEWTEKDWEYYRKPHSEWTDIEWNNAYGRYEVSQLWDLEPRITFSEFQEKVRTDKTFESENKLIPGMESEDYNSWC